MDRKQLEVTDGLTLLALLYWGHPPQASRLLYGAQTMQLKLPSLSLTHTHTIKTMLDSTLSSFM